MSTWKLQVPQSVCEGTIGLAFILQVVTTFPDAAG